MCICVRPVQPGCGWEQLSVGEAGRVCHEPPLSQSSSCPVDSAHLFRVAYLGIEISCCYHSLNRGKIVKWDRVATNHHIMVM